MILKRLKTIEEKLGDLSMRVNQLECDHPIESRGVKKGYCSVPVSADSWEVCHLCGKRMGRISYQDLSERYHEIKLQQAEKKLESAKEEEVRFRTIIKALKERV